MRKTRPALFPGRHFQDHVIVLCVRWYPWHCLTLRDLGKRHAGDFVQTVLLPAKDLRLHMAPILLAVALLGPVATGQLSRLENQRIADIQFSPAQMLDARDLAKAVPFKKGDALKADDIAAAIDGLFATGRFADVVVEGERSGDGVIVRFVTHPAWFIGGIAVEGKVATPPNRAQLVATTRLSLGAPFHDDDLTQAVNAVKKVLADNGLYEAEVTPELQQDEDTQQIFITVKLKEHKRAKYDAPVIRAETNSENVDGSQGAAERAIAPNAAPNIDETAVGQTDIKLSDSTIIRATGWRVPIIHWWRQVTDERTRRGAKFSSSTAARGKDPKAAMDKIKQAIKAKPKSAALYMTRSAIWFEKQQPEKALQDARRAVNYGDLAGRDVIPHQKRMVDRNIFHALIEIGHGIATRDHQFLHQPIGLGYRPRRIVNELCLIGAPSGDEAVVVGG